MQGKMLCVPFLYGLNTRAKTAMHRLSFFIIFAGPIAINVMLMTMGGMPWLVFVLAFSAEYAVYEIGYIYNDTYTAGREKMPTKWIMPKYSTFVKGAYPVLIACRVLFLGIVLNLLLLMKVRNMGPFCLLMAMIYCTFTAHNYFRSSANVVTDGMLQILKYCSPLVLFTKQFADLRFYIYIILEIAFVRGAEFAIGKGYFFKRLQTQSIDTLRVIYYLALLVVAIGVSLILGSIWEMIPGTLFLLLYRVFCKITSKSQKVSAERKRNSQIREEK